MTLSQLKETTTWENEKITAFYTNYKGEKNLRTLIPLEIYWGTTPYHPHPQKLLKAYDLDKKEIRDFALKDFDPCPNQA
jgi:hypothetical protein